jgi:HEPN domain-containing protein
VKVRIDPSSEVNYGFKLCLKYLEKAEKFLRTGDYKESAEASQLSAENAAKAVIALRRLPSWSHDPSGELLEVAEELPAEEKALARELAEIAHELASKHGIATYGKPVEGLTPWDIYDEGRASEMLEKARRAAELAKQIVERKEG